MLEGLAEYYSAELLQKIRRGQNESREKGNFVGGGIAYGYKVVDKKILINEDEAEAVRYIFDQYASGKVAREIIETLQQRGLTHRGKPFLSNAIYQILRNTRYIGFYYHGGKKYTNAFPPIVSEELFHTVQTMLAKNKLGSHSRDTVFLLKGKLYCGVCGKKMNGESGTSWTGKMNYYYKCATKKKKSSACPKETVRKEDIEKFVVQTTIDVLRSPGTIEKIADTVVDIHRRRWQDKSVLHLLKEDRDQKQKALKNLLTAVEEGLLTPTTKSRMTELEEEIDILNGKILMEESKEDNRITREQVMEFLYTLPEQEPQVIIDTMIRKVVLFDDKIEIHYNFCDKPENDEPDGTSPEDRRVFPISFQSTLSSSVPPDRGEGRILRPFFMPWSVVIYVLANSFALAWESTRSAALLLGLEGGIFIHDIRRRSKADLESVWASPNRFFVGKGRSGRGIRSGRAFFLCSS